MTDAHDREEHEREMREQVARTWHTEPAVEWRKWMLEEARKNILMNWPEAVDYPDVTRAYGAIEQADEAKDKIAYMEAIRNYQLAARSAAYAIREGRDPR